ncbi:3D-(3,5/4)-trihydroxycyclohexane-1,2-dione acylhydrolase (decyclizing) [Halanaerobaculum tunisiense]
MGTIRLTVAQALVKFLDNQYLEVDGEEKKFVEGIFAIFGHGNVVGLGQALEQDPGDLVVRQGRNEQGMAHAATAFAKQNNRQRIYACTSSVGPGAANMVTAAATATANRIPLLLLPGDTFACRQPDPVLQQIERPTNFTTTTNDAFRSVSKYWDRVNRPEQLMTAAINAMRVLTDPAKTGAVTICLPQDVQAEAYNYPEEFFEKRVHRLDRRPLTKPFLEEAVELITTKEKPLLICGGGVKYSEAANELKEFAEKFNIPFAETQAGKSAIVWDHELNLGGIGVTGNLAANKIAKEADLVIGVGTRFTDFTTSSKQLFQNPDVDFMGINICEFDAYKLDALPLVADAKAGLKDLTKALESRGYQSVYTDEIETVKEEWEQELDRLFNLEYTGEDFTPEVAGHLDEVLEEFNEDTGSILTQTRALGELDELLASDAIVMGASGSLPGDLQRVWRPKEPNTYHLEYGYSCMGYEVAGALGIKFAAPDQEVYAMVGDGSYMMLHSELITSIQENKKINVLLFDNMSFGCINNLQMSQGMDSFGTEFRFRNEKTGQLDDELVPIDFAASAAGYGVKTYTVTNVDELREAVKDAQKSEVSTLIDIKVLPKTMTHGYESWWRVGVPEVSNKESVQQAHKDLKAEIEKARKY